MSRPYVRTPYRQGSRGWLNEGMFTLNNFGGGINNVEPDTVIGDNEMTDTQNMRFISANLMEKRQGINYVDVETYPDLNGSIIWLDEYCELDGTQHIIRAVEKYSAGYSLKVYVDDTLIRTTAQPTPNKICGVNYVGKYYYVDGINIVVINGTDHYTILPEPMSYLAANIARNASTVTVSAIPVQAQVGDSMYFLASTINNYTGGDITRTITNINTETKVITLNSAVVTDPGQYIPATKNGKDTPVYYYVPLDTNYVMGEEVWDVANHRCYYKPCVSELADEYAGGSYIPDAPTVITAHSNRLFVSGDDESPHMVFMSGYSAVAPQPLYFPSSASVSVKPNGQPIVDMVVFDSALIIGRHEDMFVLYGNSEYPTSVVPNGTPFYIKQMDVATGFMSYNCGALLNNFYIYMGYDGRFYKLNTPTTFVEYLMTRPLPWKLDIYRSPFNITSGSLVTVSSVAYRNEILFAIDSDFVIVYNYDNMAFTYYTGWNAKSLYTDGNVLYIGTTDGKYVKWDDVGNTYTDMDVAIDAKMYTKRFDFGASANYKYFKRYMITTQTYDDLISTVDVNAEVDYFYVFDATLSSETTIFNSNKSMFGIAEWGDIFTNKDIIKSKYVNLDIKGRTIQFRFDNDKTHTLEDESVVGEPFRIYDINLIYQNRDVR